MPRRIIESETPGLSVERFDAGRKRGVFARCGFEQGALIERAPVLLVSGKQRSKIMETDLWDHWIYWGDGAKHIAIPLGFGSLYNHSYSPNAVCICNRRLKVLDYHALTDISPSDEITINYNGDPGDHSPMWFDIDGEEFTTT